MIHIKTIQKEAEMVGHQLNLVQEESEVIHKLPTLLRTNFKGKALESTYIIVNETLHLYIGVGKIEKEDKIGIKEIGAKIAKELERLNIDQCVLHTGELIERCEIGCLADLVEGLLLGDYMPKKYTNQVKEEKERTVYLAGIEVEKEEEVQSLIEEMHHVVEGVKVARDLVNAPGNHLRPGDFVKAIQNLFEGTQVEVQVFDKEMLQNMGMEALLAVGDSSVYKPSMVVLRYLGDKGNADVMGLVGKGVTCDTGGYCLKPANSMLGIKGDMAGAAAVLGAVYGLVKNQRRTNVVAALPICENRISESSLLPGDVISSYGGKTIEIVNTDAEGRLILADAVSYIVKEEKVTRILDIATLTGAVVGMLGFSIGGVLSNDEKLWSSFEKAATQAGERYLRIPYYKEHEKMVESTIADIKNAGASCCGTITAGLFIKTFAEELPWIHLDIAGTAWVDAPVFEYQSKGATGASVTTLYKLCQ